MKSKLKLSLQVKCLLLAVVMLFSVFALMLIGTSNASADTVKQEETLSTQASERAATIAPEFCG